MARQEIQTEINKRFKEVFDVLIEKHNTTKTTIAQNMGFTSTAQIDKILNNEGALSSIPLFLFCSHYKISSNYLVLNMGEMFLIEGDELAQLKQENKILKLELKEAKEEKTIFKQSLKLLQNYQEKLEEFTLIKK